MSDKVNKDLSEELKPLECRNTSCINSNGEICILHDNPKNIRNCIARLEHKKLLRVIVAADDFYVRVKEMKSAITSDRVIALNHGLKWTAGDWSKESDELQKALIKYETG